MADATFNGTTLICTLPAGGIVHTIDIQRDLYSAWKRWMVADYQNQGYPPAFATEGGFDVDPATGLKAAAYFFINNFQGWRIKPAEEDSTINFIGNLIPSSFDYSIITPTTGNFTVLINGLQPITQIAPGSVAAADVWLYQGNSTVNKEDDLIKTRKAAVAGMGLSA